MIRLIIRMLKSGIMEDGLIHASEEGTPQGSILSPLLSNIYLHYVLDLWFSRRVSRQSRGEVYYFRFADDFVACFQYKESGSADCNGFRCRDAFELSRREWARNFLSGTGGHVCQGCDRFINRQRGARPRMGFMDGDSRKGQSGRLIVMDSNPLDDLRVLAEKKHLQFVMKDGMVVACHPDHDLPLRLFAEKYLSI